MRFVRLARTAGILSAVWVYVARVLNVEVVAVSLPAIRYPVLCRPRESDPTVLCQVFGEDEANVDLPLDSQLILDGGANVGYVAVKLANRFTNAHIIAVEPEPCASDVLRKNVAKYPNITVVEAAIWSSAIKMRIRNDHVKSWATQLEPTLRSGGIPSITIDELLVISGKEMFDLVKLDIEGAEEEVFREGNDEWLLATREVLVETHSEGAKSVVISAAKARGFDISRVGEKMCLRRASDLI